MLGEDVYTAEKIMQRRKRRGKFEYLVKWRGYSTKHNTWEPSDNILDHLLIELFEASHASPNKSSTSIGSAHSTPPDNGEADGGSESGAPPKKRGRPNSRRSNGERKSYEHQLAVPEDDDEQSVSSTAPIEEVVDTSLLVAQAIAAERPSRAAGRAAKGRLGRIGSPPNAADACALPSRMTNADIAANATTTTSPSTTSITTPPRVVSIKIKPPTPPDEKPAVSAPTIAKVESAESPVKHASPTTTTNAPTSPPMPSPPIAKLSSPPVATVVQPSTSAIPSSPVVDDVKPPPPAAPVEYATIVFDCAKEPPSTSSRPIVAPPPMRKSRPSRTPPIAPRPANDMATVTAAPSPPTRAMAPPPAPPTAPIVAETKTEDVAINDASPPPPMLSSLNEADDDEAPPMLAPMLSESEVLIVRERNRVNHAAVQDKWSDPYAITVTDIRVGDKTVMIRECKSPTAFFGQSAVHKLVESTMSADAEEVSKSSTASSPLANGAVTVNGVH